MAFHAGTKLSGGELLTSAEMTPEQKNAISHRGKALRALMPAIRELVETGE